MHNESKKCQSQLFTSSGTRAYSDKDQRLESMRSMTSANTKLDQQGKLAL